MLFQLQNIVAIKQNSSGLYDGIASQQTSNSPNYGAFT